jgi:hypothetical protein
MRIVNEAYELVPINEIKPHPRNPRAGDVDMIADSIEYHGFYGAVVVQRSTRYILAGNHRWKAAVRAGATEIPVIWVDCDDDEALRILLVDNRTNDLAAYDDEALNRLLAQILTESGHLDGTGYEPGFLGGVEEAEEEAKTLLDQAVQLRPQREYVVVMCEADDEFERLKTALGLRMVRRGGYKPGSQFDSVGIERVIPARRLMERLNVGGDTE